MKGYNYIKLLSGAAASLLLLAGVNGCCCHSTAAPSFVQEQAKVEFIEFCSQFSDYSYVNWCEINAVDTQQYKADWNEDISHIIDSIGFPNEIAAENWNTLMNAKSLVHKKSLALRSVSDQKTCASIDSLEAGFDKVFLKMVSQMYYMRLFADCFDETIPPLLDQLAKSRLFNRVSSSSH